MHIKFLVVLSLLSPPAFASINQDTKSFWCRTEALQPPESSRLIKAKDRAPETLHMQFVVHKGQISAEGITLDRFVSSDGAVMMMAHKEVEGQEKPLFVLLTSFPGDLLEMDKPLPQSFQIGMVVGSSPRTVDCFRGVREAKIPDWLIDE